MRVCRRLVGVLGRRVDVLELTQLQSLMQNLPKDHPISMQFQRNDMRFEVAMHGGDWDSSYGQDDDLDGPSDGREDDLNSEEDEHYPSDEEQSYEDEEAAGQDGVFVSHKGANVQAMKDKIHELQQRLALREDEHTLLERKAVILEQKMAETTQARHLESTNDTLSKLQRKYERVLRKKDKQIEAARRVAVENEKLRVANELKALNEMQERLNQSLQRQVQHAQENQQQQQQQHMLLQAVRESVCVCVSVRTCVFVWVGVALHECSWRASTGGV